MGRYGARILHSASWRKIQVAFHCDPRPRTDNTRKLNSIGDSVDHFFKNREAGVFKRLRRRHGLDSGVSVRGKYTKIRSESLILCGNQRAACLARTAEIFVNTDIVKYGWRAVKTIGTLGANLLVPPVSLKLYHLPDSWVLQDCIY